MTEPLRRQIADAFWQEESRYEVPAGLRDEVVGAAVDGRSRTPGAPRLLAFVAVLLAGAVIVTLVGLRHLPGQPSPAGKPTPPPVTSPTPTPPPTPTPTPLLTAHLGSAVPGQLQGEAVILIETGLRPGQPVSYHITGQVDLVYDCGSGGPGGPSWPVRGPVDFRVSRTADAQGWVAATIAIPPPQQVPACTPSTRQAMVTGNWTNFVVEDATSGVSQAVGGTSVAT